MLSRMMSCWPFRCFFLPNTNRFNGWGVTLLDSLDTMYIMGLHDDFEDALGFVVNLTFSMPSVCPSHFLSLPLLLLPFPVFLPPSLFIFPPPSSHSLTSTYPPPSPVNLLWPLLRNQFEIVIRFLGGFLSAHALSSSPIPRSKTDDLGRLLPVFNTSLGLPLFAVNTTDT